MYTLAIICYSFGGLALALAIILLLVFDAKPRVTNLWGLNLGSARYEMRIYCRYAYLVLLPLGGLLHYFS
jgi:hypothetical protein